MIFDLVALAFNNIAHRKKRAFLTVVGIFIGIAAVVALVTLGQGLTNAVNEEFENIGADKLFVYPARTIGFSSFLSTTTFTEEDLKATKKVPGIVAVAPYVYKSSRTEFGGESKELFVHGSPTDDSQSIDEDLHGKVVQGRHFQSSDRSRCIVGNSLAKVEGIFKKAVTVGDFIKVNGISCKVIGVREFAGDPETDESIFIPIDFAKELFDIENYYTFAAKVQSGLKPKDLVEAVEKKLRKTRDLEEGKEDFSVLTSEQIVDTFNSIFSIVQAVVVGIAGISLLVGGIGIMNTMYTAVLERTREIGIMKAVGARNFDIAFLFLIEAGMFGFIGGLLGVGLGFGMAKCFELAAVYLFQSNLLRVTLPLGLLFGSLAFSLLVGISSGVLPAFQAAKLKPVESIQYE